jgi:hypothetical protein
MMKFLGESSRDHRKSSFDRTEWRLRIPGRDEHKAAAVADPEIKVTDGPKELATAIAKGALRKQVREAGHGGLFSRRCG